MRGGGGVCAVKELESVGSEGPLGITLDTHGDDALFDAVDSLARPERMAGHVPPCAH